MPTMLKVAKLILVIMTMVLATSFTAPECLADSATSGIPFKYANHILIIPATVNDRETYFVLDTGAGVNVISQKLAAKIGCKPAGRVKGKRMSGQSVTMKLVNLPALQVGSCLQKNVPIAAWNLEDAFGGAPELAQVEGLISLEFFKHIPFTIDYSQKMVFIETDESLKKRLSAGISIPIQVSHSPAQTSITMLVWFSNGSFATVEVDTGSGALILDEKYMKEFAINRERPEVKTVKGVDETGHPYVRYFTTLPVDVFLAQSRKFTQVKPKVQFQQIIYDGLVGDGFLSNFTVTYDLPHKRMIFARF